MMDEKEDFQEDEEISIDFGKLKSFFGGKKEGVSEGEKGLKTERPIGGKPHAPEKKPHEPREISRDEPKAALQETKEKTSREKESDDEISFDFSKIKNIFKKKEDSEAEEPSGEELSFDTKRISNYLKKNKHILVPVVLILIAVFLSAYVRVQTAYLPVTDDWAKSSVYDYFKGQIKTEIDKQYPNLPDQNKEILVNKEFDNFLKQNKNLVDEQIKGTSAYFKSQLQDENGLTYLVGLDPYFWYRHARNILEKGNPGDELRNGLPYDTHMLAPKGRYVPEDMFHAYFEVYLFKFLHLFNSNLTLIKVAFYTPVLLMSLAVIPAFLIGRRIGGDLGGFVAAVIIAIHPAILTRTIGGFADTDPYTILFPLLITWLFLIAFETKDIKKLITSTALAGFFIGLFAFTWGGWWYIFDFILATTVIYLLVYAILHRNELKEGIKIFKQPSIKNTLIIILVFLLSSGIFISLFADFHHFKTAPLAPISFVSLKQVAITSVWPNVYTTVAEQNPASLDTIISQVGFGGKSQGKVLWMLAVIGIILTFFKKDIHGKRDMKYAILLILWILATMYASTKGVRYTQLVIPAFSISVGVALGLAHEFIVRWASKELHINKLLVSTVLIVLIVVIFLVGPVRAGMSIGKNSVTDMNDPWYSSLEKINREAKPDAIINSWWDFGHWFKAIGDRAVTFDGTSQNSPQAHWIGKALLTDNEDVAVGILRMLDCGANSAFDELDKVVKDPIKSIDIINEIIVLDKEQAKRALKKEGLTDEQIGAVIKNTHCDPPEDYFITSSDMIQKSGVWAHFGSWDFERAMIYNTLQKPEYSGNLEKSVEFMEVRFNYSSEKARETYSKVQSFEKGGREVNDWIAPWPGYASGANSCSVSGNIATCRIVQGGQAIVDLTTMNVNVPSSEGMMHPDSLAYVTKDGFFEKKSSNNTLGLGMILIPSGNSYRNVLTSPQLASSMFTRMFYLKGHGLRYFKLFSYQRSNVGGDEIYVWKVDWNGKEKNIAEEFFPKKGLSETKLNETAQNETLIAEEIKNSTKSANIS